MLTVTLIHNASPVEKIGKSLTTGETLSCVLKDDTSILKPVLEIRTSNNVASYNYMYIQEFDRYYFIDDIKSINNNLWSVSAHVDVLETYKTAILANDAVIKRQRSQYNLYLDDNEFKLLNKEQIQTLKFKQTSGGGLIKNLQYVLVVNGSAANQGGGA